MGRDPGAEPLDEFDARLEAGIERIVAAHPDELVVAVVHGGVIGQLLHRATGSTPVHVRRCRQRSISELVVLEPSTWHAAALQRHRPSLVNGLHDGEFGHRFRRSVGFRRRRIVRSGRRRTWLRQPRLARAREAPSVNKGVKRKGTPWPVQFYGSAVGKKWVMAVTGLGL